MISTPRISGVPYSMMTNYPAANRILITSLVFVSAIVAVLSLFPPTGRDTLVNTPSADQPHRIYPEITGLSSKIYGDGGITTWVKAARIAVGPRRILFFNLHSVNEIQMTNVRIKHYLSAISPEDESLTPLTLELINLGGGQDKTRHRRNGVSVISRVVIDDLSLELLRADIPAIALQAERAYLRKDRHPRFFNAFLEDPASGKRIYSKKILWNSEIRKFQIPGKYIAQTPAGKASGENIQVDIDFKVTAL